MSPAIFIDFEALKSSNANPALLAILIDRGDTQSFEQVVLDERLRPAIVARPHVRDATLDDTVSRIVGLDLPIVGWSLFDRELVARSDVDPELTALWVARYLNALAEARTWRTKVHPDFRITRASRFDPKHTLDRYAELAGYPDAAGLRGAQPAKWIRHVLDQLAARKHYRRVTRQAKRDWHKLLEYNRHDCFALRHVYLKARSELQKWRAYEKTDYCVDGGGRRPVCFRIGGASARLDALLARYGSPRWAFMTAWNPASKPLPREENDRRQTELIAQLTVAGYRCLRAEGRNADAPWPPEESVLALDIPKGVARRIGHQYGQLAIVAGERGSPAQLVPCL
jgi:Protein of unknown function (DUF3293)